jgi:hypothetical protein
MQTFSTGRAFAHFRNYPHRHSAAPAGDPEDHWPKVANARSAALMSAVSAPENPRQRREADFGQLLRKGQALRLRVILAHAGR